MTAIAEKPRHEPAEAEDTRNVVLDLVEHSLRQAIALGLEAPLRARLARILPEPAAAAESGDLWEATVVLTALAEARRRVTSPSSRALIDTAHGFALGRVNALKSGDSQ